MLTGINIKGKNVRVSLIVFGEGLRIERARRLVQSIMGLDSPCQHTCRRFPEKHSGAKKIPNLLLKFAIARGVSSLISTSFERKSRIFFLLYGETPALCAFVPEDEIKLR